MDIDFTRYYWKNDLIQMRQPKEEDCDFICQEFYHSEDRFLWNGEIELPLDPDGYRQQYLIQGQEKKDYLQFAILDRQGKHVGIANIFGIDERHGCFGPVGIWINSADRGKGYAFYAMCMLGLYMFQERRMHKWESGCVKGNAASETLHEKLGFAVEGVRRENSYHTGRYWDEVLYGITEEEFLQKHREMFRCN